MSERVLLYHISRLEEGHRAIQEFIPRIPKQRAIKEDDTIPRICVADTVDGCVLAHPDAVPNIQFAMGLDLLEETGEIGLLFRIYHFWAKKEDVLFPTELTERGLVPDAVDTSEHWLLTPHQPNGVSYIFVPAIGFEHFIMQNNRLEYENLGHYGSWGKVSPFDADEAYAS